MITAIALFTRGSYKDLRGSIAQQTAKYEAGGRTEHHGDGGMRTDKYIKLNSNSIRAPNFEFTLSFILGTRTCSLYRKFEIRLICNGDFSTVFILKLETDSLGRPVKLYSELVHELLKGCLGSQGHPSHFLFVVNLRDAMDSDYHSQENYWNEP